MPCVMLCKFPGPAPLQKPSGRWAPLEWPLKHKQTAARTLACSVAMKSASVSVPWQDLAPHLVLLQRILQAPELFYQWDEECQGLARPRARTH